MAGRPFLSRIVVEVVLGLLRRMHTAAICMNKPNFIPLVV